MLPSSKEGARKSDGNEPEDEGEEVPAVKTEVKEGVSGRLLKADEGLVADERADSEAEGGAGDDAPVVGDGDGG